MTAAEQTTAAAEVAEVAPVTEQLTGTFEERLEQFCKARETSLDEIKELEDLCLDGFQFPDDKVSAADWKLLSEKFKNLRSFSLVDANLKAIELPESGTVDSQIEVLDVSDNPEIEDYSFLKGFKQVIGVTVGTDSPDSKLTKFEQLEGLLGNEHLRVLEVNHQGHLGFTDDEEMRQHLFSKFLTVLGINGLDKEGFPLDAGMEEEEEDFFGDELFEEEDDDSDLNDEEGSPEDGERAEEAGEDAEKEADSDEPAAKRQKEE